MNHTIPLRPSPAAETVHSEASCHLDKVRDLLERLKETPVEYPALEDRRAAFVLQARRTVILNVLRTEAMTITRCNALMEELAEIETQLGKE